MATESREFSDRAGAYLTVREGGETYRVFHPKPLPPDPPIAIDDELLMLLDRASRAIGHLDGSTVLLPDPEAFIHSYVRKEAILSSQIEGTQSSLSELLLLEQGSLFGPDTADAKEVSNYVAAMNHGLDRIAGGFPLTLRLIREVHAILMDGTRGATQSPGAFRRGPVWIGGERPAVATFMPPPANELDTALANLEKFIQGKPTPLPPLLTAAIAHAQFETIHPFFDGNGRIGRLLITLMLSADGVLARPLLYLSLYLKQHRAVYYERLQAVRERGDWEGWIRFFLEAVAVVADEAARTTHEILALFERDKQRLTDLKSPTGLRVHSYVSRNVYMSAPKAAKELGLTSPTIYKAVEALVEMGMLAEVTGQKRNRVFVHIDYLRLLQGDEGDAVALASG